MSESHSSTLSCQQTHATSKRKRQKSIIPEPEHNDHNVGSYQAADPYSLENNPGAAPNVWSIPQGPDSGFYSFDLETDLETLRQQTLEYITTVPDNDDPEHTSPSQLPIDCTLSSNNTIFSPGGMLDDESLTGIATEPLPHIEGLEEEEDLITPNAMTESMDLMDHHMRG